MSMICPETYYKMNLKGKSEKEILTVIRELKNEIGHLKNVIEHPGYQSTMCPSELVRLKCSRDYLERAKKALVDMGCTYQPSKAEQSAVAFQEKINHISKVVLEVGGYFQGLNTYTAQVNGNVVEISKEKMLNIIPPSEEEEASYSRNEFLELFANLHIGEWRKHYSTHRFGIEILDGTQWSLDIYYDDDTKCSFDGDNAYPYNFYDLNDLFGIEDEA